MTRVNVLIERWEVQQWNALKHLPCHTTHQRKAYWKAERRLRRRIRGRAERVASHLINLDWCARMAATEEVESGYDETYAITV